MRPSENVLNRHRTGISGSDHPPKNPSPKPGQRFSTHGILFSVLITGALLVFLAGCTPQTQSVSIPVDTTQTFSDAGTQEIPEKWWTVFGDEELNIFVDSALTSNFNLLTAWQRLREAQAVVDRESASFFPSLDASVQGEVSQYQSQFVQDQQLSLGLSSGYEIDLWGRISSRVEAQRYREQATREDYRTAALSLSAEVARVWYQLVEARNELKLIRDQIRTNEKVLTLLESRFGSGQIRSVDILRQRQLLEATREQQINAEGRLEVLKHQLSVLLGNVPQSAATAAEVKLPDLPPLPEAGIPTDLIRRRPDIQTAFNRLKAADREVASAISSRYPRLSLSASASTAADNARDLFQDWSRRVAGNLLTPLFYGGQLKAEVDRTQAVKQQRLYEYGQTVLNAFREVEDALIREEKQKQTIESIRQQLELARQSYEQLRIEYFNGMSGYLDVLTALDEQQQLRRNLLSARLRLLEHRIALYRSLAGGFEVGSLSNE
ncbi:MAG: TolC family protein [Bacteroidales bacterium]|nr:TolC family protein [Bacteroidales bacterium]